MKPPAGRIAIGDRVALPGGLRGRVVGERLIASNGAWKYTVALDGGGTREQLDFELARIESGKRFPRSSDRGPIEAWHMCWGTYSLTEISAVVRPRPH